MSWRHSSMKCQTNSGHKHKMWARKGLAETLQSNSSKRKGGPRRVTSKTNGLQTKLKMIWRKKKRKKKSLKSISVSMKHCCPPILRAKSISYAILLQACEITWEDGLSLREYYWLDIWHQQQCCTSMLTWRRF